MSDGNGGILKAVDLHKVYELGKDNLVHALRGASLTVRRGEMLAIMGPSGSGKSTIMHIMGCLDRPDRGEVWLDGHRVDNLKSGALNQVRSRDIGFIFQGFNLIPTFTATENVALAGEYAGLARRQAKAAAVKALRDIGLGDRLDHKPSELSGGQQQRVAIARALVNGPHIVLGDEPTGDLDTATSQEIIEMMRQINTDTGTSFVLVTHNPDVADACDRKVCMRDGLVTEEEVCT